MDITGVDEIIEKTLKSDSKATQSTRRQIDMCVFGGSASYSLHMSPQVVVVSKKFFGGFRHLCFTLICQSPPGAKLT